jgi:hypothetical protein
MVKPVGGVEQLLGNALKEAGAFQTDRDAD